MNTIEHGFVGALLRDRIVGALELCCRRGEMLLIQNERVNWDICPIGRYLNVTDEELRRGLEVSWDRPLRAASGG